MNLNNRDLDRILRQKLEDYEVNAPSSAWKEVERQALDKKSRRFPWLWIGAGALLACILAAALFLPFEDSQDGRQAEEKSNEEQLSTSPNTQTNKRETDVLSSDEFPAETSEIQRGESVSEDEQSVTSSQSGEQDRVSDAQGSSQPALEQSNQAGPADENTDQSTPSESNSDELDQSDRKTASDRISKTFEQPSDASIGKTDSKTGGILGYRMEPLSKIAPSSPFEAFERRLLTEEEAKWVDPCQNGLFKGDECYGLKSKSPIRFALSWYYGAEFPLRSLTTKDPELSSYADLRNNTETYAYSHGMGVRASMKWYSGLKVGTGLHLSKWQEKFNYTDEDAEIVNIINVTVDTLIDATDTIIVWDTLSVTQKGTKHYRNTNSYTFVDLPLLVGYEVKGKNLNISINTGVFLHLLFKTEGQALAANEHPVRYNNRDRTDHSVFKTNIGASLYTSVGFFYKLDKHWDIKLEPSIKYMLKPVTLSSYPLEQRYISFNIYMGMRYRF